MDCGRKFPGVSLINFIIWFKTKDFAKSYCSAFSLTFFLLEDVNLPKKLDVPTGLTREEESWVMDSVQQEKQEMEKLLNRKKELILREEEEEVKHPQREVSALDRLGQRNIYESSQPEPSRVARFATKDWEKSAGVEKHKKIILGWCVGSILFASMLGFICVTWRCCRERKKEDPSPLEFVCGFFALFCKRKKPKASPSIEEAAQNSVELEPLQINDQANC